MTLTIMFWFLKDLMKMTLEGHQSMDTFENVKKRERLEAKRHSIAKGSLGNRDTKRREYDDSNLLKEVFIYTHTHRKNEKFQDDDSGCHC